MPPTGEDRKSRRRADRWNRRHAGKPVHTRVGKGGYRYFWLFADGKRRLMRADRVVWALAHGDYPLGEIIHVNGDNADDALSNLRDSGATS
jgi:hypothetical protein